MNCTQCRSDNTQRLAIIYEQGTSEIRTSSTSVGFGGGGGGLGIGTASTSTRGTQQTKLARKLAPPGHRPSALAVAAAVCIGLFASLAMNTPGATATLVTLTCFAGIAVCLSYAVYWERFVRAPQLAGWQRTWHCNRCGTVYSEPGAYDRYNATQPTGQLFAGVTAAVSAGCLFVVFSSMESMAAAQSAAKEKSASAVKSVHSPKLNARLNRDYELSTFQGSCRLPQGTAVADNGPMPNWRRLYKEPMEKIAIGPGLCSNLGQHHDWVAPRAVLEPLRVATE